MARRHSPGDALGVAAQGAIYGGPVNSSAIRAIAYNPNEAALMVTFNSGRSYVYSNVSPQRFRAFENADSKGKYFNAAIRDNYAYRRVG